jgi:hypothetical protein
MLCLMGTCSSCGSLHTSGEPSAYLMGATVSQSIFAEVEKGNVHAVVALAPQQRHLCEQRAPHGDTPLTVACRNGHSDMVESLLALRALVDQRMWSNRTALMVAAGAGSVKCLQALLRHGATLEAEDKSGMCVCMCVKWRYEAHMQAKPPSWLPRGTLAGRL